MILALETAGYGNSSVALFRDDKFVEQTFLSSGRATTVELIPAIQTLLNKHDVDKKNIKFIAVDCGPGSFTGIRVGIATANGLSDGWKTQAIGISQFDIYPSVVDHETEQLILIDAKAGGGFYYELRRYELPGKRGFIHANEISIELPLQTAKRYVYSDVDNELLIKTCPQIIKEKVDADARAVGISAQKKIKEGKIIIPKAIYLHTRIKPPEKPVTK